LTAIDLQLLVGNTGPATGGWVFMTRVLFRVTVNTHTYTWHALIHIICVHYMESFFSMHDDNEPKLSETEKKKLSLQETRTSLPIFPFRHDLIQAVRDHQVSHPYGSKITRFNTVIKKELYKFMLIGIVCYSVCIIE